MITALVFAKLDAKRVRSRVPQNLDFHANALPPNAFNNNTRAGVTVYTGFQSRHINLRNGGFAGAVRNVSKLQYRLLAAVD